MEFFLCFLLAIVLTGGRSAADIIHGLRGTDPPHLAKARLRAQQNMAALKESGRYPTTASIGDVFAAYWGSAMAAAIAHRARVQQAKRVGKPSAGSAAGRPAEPASPTAGAVPGDLVPDPSMLGRLKQIAKLMWEPTGEPQPAAPSGRDADHSREDVDEALDQQMGRVLGPQTPGGQVLRYRAACQRCGWQGSWDSYGQAEDQRDGHRCPDGLKPTVADDLDWARMRREEALDEADGHTPVEQHAQVERGNDNPRRRRDTDDQQPATREDQPMATVQQVNNAINRNAPNCPRCGTPMTASGSDAGGIAGSDVRARYQCPNCPNSSSVDINPGTGEVRPVGTHNTNGGTRMVQPNTNGGVYSEVTGIPSLVAYAKAVAAAHNAHGGDEGLLGSMARMEVGAGHVSLAQAAQEASRNAAALWNEFAKAVSDGNAPVREGYMSNPDAANKAAQLAE